LILSKSSISWAVRSSDRIPRSLVHEVACGIFKRRE
jgi:hypothetical protein